MRAREVPPISLDAIFTGGALLAATHGARGAPGRGERRALAAVSDAAGRRFGRCKVRINGILLSNFFVNNVQF